MVLQDDEKHHSPCGTLDNTELFNLLLEKHVFNVFTLNGEREKKSVLCRFFCSLQSRSVGLQKQSVSLSSAFYSFYTVCTGAHLISQPRHTQAHYLDLHKTESEASHMGNDVFPSFGKKQKTKKKKTEKKSI